MSAHGPLLLRSQHGLLLAMLLGCDPGPILVLGRLAAEAGPDASEAGDAAADGGDQDAAAEAGDQNATEAGARDREPEPCTNNRECERDERPYCSDELGRCVECVQDWQCDDEQYCRERTGECVRSRS